jgi:hypothetical protein
MVNIALTASELNRMLEMEEQLQWVIQMAEKLRQGKMKDLEAKKCNFFNRGVCKEGLVYF